MKKNILVIAKHNKVEALRVAAGLTLMDDMVSVAVLGGLDDSPSVQEQIEALDFGEVPRNPTGKIEKPKLRERYKDVRWNPKG